MHQHLTGTRIYAIFKTKKNYKIFWGVAFARPIPFSTLNLNVKLDPRENRGFSYGLYKDDRDKNVITLSR